MNYGFLDGKQYLGWFSSFFLDDDGELVECGDRFRNVYSAEKQAIEKCKRVKRNVSVWQIYNNGERRRLTTIVYKK